MTELEEEKYDDDELIEILHGKKALVRRLWLDKYAQAKGFDNYDKYRDSIAIERGFRSWDEYRKFLDKNRKKIEKEGIGICKPEAIAVLRNKERILEEYSIRQN